MARLLSTFALHPRKRNENGPRFAVPYLLRVERRLQRDADSICEIGDADDDQGDPLPLGELRHDFTKSNSAHFLFTCANFVRLRHETDGTRRDFDGRRRSGRRNIGFTWGAASTFQTIGRLLARHSYGKQYIFSLRYLYTVSPLLFFSSRLVPSPLIRARMCLLRAWPSVVAALREARCSLLRTLQESRKEGRRSNDMSYHGSNFIIGQHASERLSRACYRA